MTILQDFISIFFELSIHFITSPSLFLLLLLGFLGFFFFCFVFRCMCVFSSLLPHFVILITLCLILMLLYCNILFVYLRLIKKEKKKKKKKSAGSVQYIKVLCVALFSDPLQLGSAGYNRRHTLVALYGL